jgi:hypothetical protein
MSSPVPIHPILTSPLFTYGIGVYFTPFDLVRVQSVNHSFFKRCQLIKVEHRLNVERLLQDWHRFRNDSTADLRIGTRDAMTFYSLNLKAFHKTWHWCMQDTSAIPFGEMMTLLPLVVHNLPLKLSVYSETVQSAGLEISLSCMPRLRQLRVYANVHNPLFGFDEDEISVPSSLSSVWILWSSSDAPVYHIKPTVYYPDQCIRDLVNIIRKGADLEELILSDRCHKMSYCESCENYGCCVPSTILRIGGMDVPHAPCIVWNHEVGVVQIGQEAEDKARCQVALEYARTRKVISKCL